MNRRDFIKNSVKTAGLLSLAKIPNTVFASEKIMKANDVIVLGKSNIKTSRMAMGTGSNGWRGSSNQTRKLGLKGLAELLNYAYDRGITFWDSADRPSANNVSGAHLQKIDAKAERRW